jgi:hypothetical protein
MADARGFEPWDSQAPTMSREIRRIVVSGWDVASGKVQCPRTQPDRRLEYTVTMIRQFFA